MDASKGGVAMKKYLRIIFRVFLILTLITMSVSCTKTEEKETEEKKEEKTESTTETKEAEFEVTSSAFDNDADIPVKYAHSDVSGGENVSIPLTWKNAPEGTKSFAITMVDTNESANNFLHWLVINIPPDATSIEEGASGKNMPDGTTEFKNGYGTDGYGGPAPPPGDEHDYEITVYALDIDSMGMSENAGLDQFTSFIEGKVLGKATISGEFSQ